MRFILQDDVQERLPADWETKRAEAEVYVGQQSEDARAEALEAGKTPAEANAIALKARHAAINRRSQVWTSTADALRFASHEKCWYCESLQDRSDMPVDHFRPKNSVYEDDAHPGYWWKAFDWRNYRYSCTYCNSRRIDQEGGTSGGKRDHFPILPPPDYARAETDPEDRPKLLDPTVDDDTKLMTFLPNGYVATTSVDAVQSGRVTTSIEMYHLDHAPLVRRRRRLADDISQHVRFADLAQVSGDTQQYRFHKKELIKRVRGQAEFTSAARVYLQAYRTHEWVEEVLSRDL